MRITDSWLANAASPWTQNKSAWRKATSVFPHTSEQENKCTGQNVTAFMPALCPSPFRFVGRASPECWMLQTPENTIAITEYDGNTAPNAEFHEIDKVMLEN